LASLADDDRPGADDQDFLQVSTLWHGFPGPRSAASLRRARGARPPEARGETGMSSVDGWPVSILFTPAHPPRGGILQCPSGRRRRASDSASPVEGDAMLRYFWVFLIAGGLFWRPAGVGAEETYTIKVKETAKGDRAQLESEETEQSHVKVL